MVVDIGTQRAGLRKTNVALIQSEHATRRVINPIYLSTPLLTSQ